MIVRIPTMFEVHHLTRGIDAHQLEHGPQHTVHRLLGDDHGARVDADAAAGADAEEDGVLDARVVHELDNLVQQDADRGDAHAVLRSGDTGWSDNIGTPAAIIILEQMCKRLQRLMT